MTRGAAKLKAWRTAAKMSQEAAGKRAGVSQAAWSAWESGRKRPDIDSVVHLAAMTAASEHAVTLHDFVETEDEAAERRALRKVAS